MGANKILNLNCDLLDMLKLIEMFTVMIRVTILDNTGDFPKYAFLLRVGVFAPTMQNCFMSDMNKNIYLSIYTSFK